MKKMLFLTDGFGRGGAESKLLELLQLLDTDRYDITVACFVDQGLLRDEYFALEHRTMIIPRDPGKRFDFSLLFRLYRHMRRERYEVLQTMLFIPDVVGTFVGWLARIPLRLAWETASHHNPEYLIPFRQKMYRFALRFVSKIITVSKEGKESIHHWHPVPDEKITVIHYGIDLKRWQLPRPGDRERMRDELGLDHQAPVLGLVARFYEVKGHCYLIEALALLKERFPQLICVLVGEDGGTREATRAQVKALELEGRIRFFESRRDIPEVLKAFDCFVLPSVSEGLPNVILEAMAVGLPVVASNVGGIPEQVEDGVTGYLFEPQNPRSLADALASLFGNKEAMAEMGRRSRERVEAYFSLEHQIKSFKALYDGKDQA